MAAKNPATMFKPGESGNPAGPKPKRKRGRPKGAVSSPAGQIRRAIAEHAPELIDNLLKASREGDTSATLGLLDRIVPRIRSTAPPVTIPLTGERDDVTERILQAVADGEIAPADGTELLAFVRAALGEEPPRFEPIDREKLDAIYATAMARAESERLRIRAAIEAGTRGGEPT